VGLLQRVYSTQGDPLDIAGKNVLLTFGIVLDLIWMSACCEG